MNGVFGRAVPMAVMPVVKRQVYTLAEHRRYEAQRKAAAIEDLKRALAWAVCISLWIVVFLLLRA